MALRRRQFLIAAALSPAAGYRRIPGPVLFNPCLDAALPESLARHDILLGALDGLQGEQLWDVHVHLAGTGDGGSGIWINPAMRSFLHPLQAIRYYFYLNAACAPESGLDDGYLVRLARLQEQLPPGARAMLLALDYAYDERGERQARKSALHVPDAYAAEAASRYPQRFGWAASVHPYREDCEAALRWAAEHGARAVKWLPPAMGIDPASPLCDRFYGALARLGLPLLVHAGNEQALAGPIHQSLGNPLRLRRGLEHGVRIIVAHCASLGAGVDLDAGPDGPLRPNLELFARLMDEPRYERLLFGEISALTQRNRLGAALDTVVTRTGWHHRLVNGSDYPLPAVIPIYSLRELVQRRYISQAQAVVLAQVRQHNALIFDLALKRLVRVGGLGFDRAVFHSRRLFEPRVAA